MSKGMAGTVVPAERVFTQARLMEAFGGQLLILGAGAVVVDQCCALEGQRRAKA